MTHPLRDQAETEGLRELLPGHYLPLIALAWHDGFMAALGRAEWDDASDYAAVSGQAYAKSVDLQALSAHPRQANSQQPDPCEWNEVMTPVPAGVDRPEDQGSAPALSQPRSHGNDGGLPEGWALVPREPTEEMVRAAGESGDSFDIDDFEGVSFYPARIYHTMLAAAPSPPSHGTSLSAPEQAVGSAEEADRCIACAEWFEEGERYYPDAGGGFIHADCCGPERESYTGADGGPLKPGEPIPKPLIWEGRSPDAPPRAHARDCDYHCDQDPRDCTCGLTAPSGLAEAGEEQR